MIKYLSVIVTCCLLAACNYKSNELRSQTPPILNTTGIVITQLSLPQIGGHNAEINKVSANKDHVFFAYRIPTGTSYASGLLIKDAQDHIEVLSNFNGPMRQSTEVPGIVGKISALSAFEQGAWVALTSNTEADKPWPNPHKTLIAQIDNDGVFHSSDYADRSEILKLIPLKEGLLSLEYEGLNTPKLYKGDATRLGFGNNWQNFTAFKLTASEMGDAALDMLVQDEKTIIAVSGGGIYKGLVGAREYEKTWLSDSYAKPPVEIFPGAPNSMAFYQGKLAIGSFTHILNPTTQTKGFIFCDPDQTSAINPCEDPKEARAKEYEIKKMIVFKDYLFMASIEGLLRYDGQELQVITSKNPSNKLEVIGSLPSDDIVDLAVQGNVLWIVTKSGVASLRIKTKA